MFEKGVVIQCQGTNVRVVDVAEVVEMGKRPGYPGRAKRKPGRPKRKQLPAKNGANDSPVPAA